MPMISEAAMHPFNSMITLDVEKKDIKKLKIGDTIEATIKGTIKELEGEDQYETCSPCGEGEEEVRVIPPRVRIELTEAKVTQPNEFSALIDDDEDE